MPTQNVGDTIDLTQNCMGVQGPIWKGNQEWQDSSHRLPSQARSKIAMKTWTTTEAHLTLSSHLCVCNPVETRRSEDFSLACRQTPFSSGTCQDPRETSSPPRRIDSFGTGSDFWWEDPLCERTNAFLMRFSGLYNVSVVRYVVDSRCVGGFCVNYCIDTACNGGGT